MLLACALLAAAAPVVEGRVGEPGAGAARAQVILVQGESRQVVRTRADGTFRFRSLARPGSVSVVLPAGWTLNDAQAKDFGASFPGDVVRLDFSAHAHRSLHGRLLLSGVPFAGVQVSAGLARARTDAGGAFALEEMPPGEIEVRVEGLGLVGAAKIPPSPGEVSRDFELQIRTLQELDLVPVPQRPALRPIADWAEARPMSAVDADRLEKLCALVNLDGAFRLAILAHPSDVGRAALAAVMVQRFLTGPCLVPTLRVVFAVGEVVSPGRLAVLLARQENH